MKRSLAALSSSSSGGPSSGGPASKKPKVTPKAKSASTSVTVTNGRYITNGYPDPLRNYAGSYNPSSGTPVSHPLKATITRKPVIVRDGKIVAESSSSSLLPKRDNQTKELLFPDFPEFRPNLTPSEVILLGSFGGTYFRDIYSAPAKKAFNGKSVFQELPYKDWGWIDLQDSTNKLIQTGILNPPSDPNSSLKPKPIVIKSFSTKQMLTSNTYSTSINRFGVKCGGSLDMWESSGWINPIDPFGWFHWFCWFYLGRRCSDDKRQIDRWMGAAGNKGRFKNQLLNKCKAAKKCSTDASISPVIRQTLQHWGVDVKKGMKK